ncbi:von Willebrand factor D and EGF domain-containing protein-like isoform X2 [Anneissia japonica]|uniref:von Willebrand factor D and EGF domain-containing protein-like isoform X2 n=1 Tax=Anneissia japonica TaxID=1529436 RepID=UPI0014259E27|nr:von Willebrand factor D and EGF domain-containing protein-like isoform X2 [Anneissia japonica]
MRLFRTDIMKYFGTLRYTSILVRSFYIFMFVGSSFSEFDECSSGGHRIIDDPYRSKNYGLGRDEGVGGRCDNALERGWYVFMMYGKFAEMPTECVNVNYCGTSGPIWLDTMGQSLPLPGENRTFESCATLKPRNYHPKLERQHCCGFRLPVIVRNCGDFFVYFLSPTPSCMLAYCVQEMKVRCKPSEYSTDGFAPCREKYPTLARGPKLSIAIREDGAYLSSVYEISFTEQPNNVVYQVTWYKTVNENLTEIFATETNEPIAFLPLKTHIRMGDEILCKVSTFFNNTREMKSPAIDSEVFKAEIKISSDHLALVENGESHKVIFETTVPVVCGDTEGKCSITIPLTLDKDEHNLHPDIAISECAVEIKPRKCSKRNCGKGVVYIKAVTDFMRDGNRVSNLRTGAIVSDDEMWNGYNIDDIKVSVKDVTGGQCYSFTDPHFITFDRLKYDFYKTGTYILHKSLNRDFEVNSRIWNCGGAKDEISCNCGFVARENNDIISVDMCNGVLLETQPEVKIMSLLPLEDGVKIKESKSGNKITVSFPSGAFVRGDISDWGMSITVQVPSSDFNHTCGLCGIFDGDPNNDYHYEKQNKMDIDMKFGQPNEFVELWRLRDGGLFNNLQEHKKYPKRKHFCNCEKPPGSTLTPEHKCSRYDDVIRTNLINSKDITAKFKAKSSEPRHKRSLTLQNEHDLHQFTPLIQHETVFDLTDGNTTNDEYYFYPDDNYSDLRPVNPTWPTPTGITQSQAAHICEKKLGQSNSNLASLCSETLGTEMYIEDAIAICVADLQLTDDFRWDSYAYTLIENECERALLENQTLWTQNDDTSRNHISSLQKSLNCPYNCSGNGKCTSLGCDCDDGFSTIDCSVRYDTPTVTRIGDNGLCDKRTRVCDVIKINVVNVSRTDVIRCHLNLLNSNEELTEFDSIGTFRNKQTVFCPIPKTTIKDARSPTKWAVQCNWKGICNLTMDFCFIEQTCRSVGETSPTNDCFTCLPNLNIYDWSIKEDNLIPIFPVPPPLFVFAGNTLEYQLEASDLDGDVIVYDILGKEDGVSLLATDGKLLWVPKEVKQVLIPVTATDKCGAIVSSVIKVNVMECPCQNDGKCMSDKEYKKMDVVCICRDGFNGPHCEGPTAYDLIVDACRPDPCKYGSCSFSIDGIFYCHCDDGYTGLLCEQSLTPCDPNPCFEGVNCILVPDMYLGFRCEPCPNGYNGDGIKCRRQCSVTCPNNMQCSANNQCTCQDGWTGFGCKIAICRPDCQNGICAAPNECRCYAGYTGKRCSEAICKPDCKHGGKCYAPNVCVCPSGFVGAHCETMTCRVNCQNGGFCSDPDTCICPAGYSGPTCSQAVCQPGCMNGGMCVEPSRCLCSRGYSGNYCQRGICHETCMNGGTCVRTNVCSCLPGFIGKRCEIPKCENRCLNNGRCVAPNTCSCASGWRGRHCQRAICNNGCKNGGVCIKPNVCACQQGYGGASCQTPKCRRVCMYGGRCVAPDRCACRHRYTGAYCEKRSSSVRYYHSRRHNM